MRISIGWLHAFSYFSKIKMNKPLFRNIFAAFVASMLSVPLTVQADGFPSTSYELSPDGKTLVKWLGEESVIDMTTDPMFGQVTTIGDEAFAFNGTFTYIKLSDNVTAIGTSAFNLSTALETIVLPESLVNIGEKAFRKCSSMKSIALPANLKTIGKMAFENCEKLESITIPNSVTTLEFMAFTDCSGMKSVVLSSGIREWGENTFSYCTSLESVTIPDGITFIPTATFQNCYALETVTLPYTLKRIGENAFADMYHDYDNIKKVTCRSLTPPQVNGVWSARQQNADLYVPGRGIDAYRNNAEWGLFGSIQSYDGEQPYDSDFEVNADSVIAQLQRNMVRVQGGSFMMGTDDDQEEGSHVERPAHQVTLSSFLISKYEVTQDLWKAIMGDNPSETKGSGLPVESVSWQDCQQFIEQLNARTGLHYRLPTEAEWEYAARGGNKSAGYKYSGSNLPDNVAWYDYQHFAWSDDPFDENGIEPDYVFYHIHPVGEKMANELGLYDMSGNVGEWCSDWADWANDLNAYTEASVTNPQGLPSGSVRIIRGGDFLNTEYFCRVTCRGGMNPDYSNNTTGLRLVLDTHAETACSMSLVIKAKDGTEAEYKLRDFPKVKIERPYIIVNSGGTEITFDLSKTDRFYYKKYDKEASGIDDVRVDSSHPFAIDGDEIAFHHLPDNTLIEIYGIDGRKFRSSRASGSATFSMMMLPPGVYVIKVNSSTYKISKR